MGDRAGFFAAVSQNGVEVAGVGEDGVIFGLDRLQVGDGGFGEEGFELAPAHVLAFGGDGFFGLAGHQHVEGEQVGAFGPGGIAKDEAAGGVGFTFFDFGLDQFGGIQEIDAAEVGGVGFGHFAGAVGEAHDAGTIGADQGGGGFEDGGFGFAKLMVDAIGDVAGEFDMLLLVFANGDFVGIVEENIGGHEDGVVE